MSVPTIMKASEFDVSKISYGEIKPMGTTGAKQMYLNYNGMSQVILQTPKMRIPYGLGKYQEDGKAPKYTLDLSFSGMDDDSKIKEFYESIKSIDDKIISDCRKNSLAWLKKKNVSEDVARELFATSIKYSKDESGDVSDKYPPTFKAKVPFWEDKFTCSLYDHKKNKIDGDFTSYLPKGQAVKAIVKCSGVWFSGGKYGVSWKVDQVKVDEPRAILSYAFRDDDSDDEL